MSRRFLKFDGFLEGHHSREGDAYQVHEGLSLLQRTREGMHDASTRTDADFLMISGIFQSIASMNHKGKSNCLANSICRLKTRAWVLIRRHPVVVQPNLAQRNDLGMLEGFEQIVFHFLVISASLCGMPAQCQINFRVLVSKLHSLVNGCSVKTDHIVEGNPISLAKSNSWTRPSNCSTLRWVGIKICIIVPSLSFLLL